MQKSALALQSLLYLIALSSAATCLARTANPMEMDNDLFEVTVTRLQAYYAQQTTLIILSAAGGLESV